MREECADHLFLCPRKALGRPVKMRTVPRTPKAGSILVARSVGETDCEGVDVDDAEALILEVGVAIVRVTLKTVGRTVTRERV